MPHNVSRHSIRMLALFLTCAAIAPARAQTDEQLLRALDSAWRAAFNARDTIKLVTFYAPEAVTMFPNIAAVKGTVAIGKTYGAMVRTPGMTLAPTRTSTLISKSGDLATNVGTYRLSYTSPNGPVADSGSYVEVLQKVNGQWRIVNEIVTSAAPTPTVAVYDTTGSMAMAGGSAITWTDLKVNGFPPGAKMAVIHGDPSGSGDYAVRLQFPAGYQFPVHWHPKAEHVTVLSGTLLLGMGGTRNESAVKPYNAGDFLYLPARNPHFGGARGPTVIQLHGIGPFAINLGTP